MYISLFLFFLFLILFLISISPSNFLTICNRSYVDTMQNYVDDCLKRYKYRVFLKQCRRQRIISLNSCVIDSFHVLVNFHRLFLTNVTDFRKLSNIMMHFERRSSYSWFWILLHVFATLANCHTFQKHSI